MTNSIQNNIEGIVPKIQFFVLDSFKIQSEITNLEYQLSNIPEAMRLNEEIRNLKKSLLENQSSENSLREE